MNESQKKLFVFLEQLKIDAKTHYHEAIFKVSEGQEIEDSIGGGHTRNLFLKDKKNQYFLITLGAHAPLDLKILHTKIGASGRLSFGSPEKLHEYLGLYPGSVSVFGLINDHDKNVTLILDSHLMDNDYINCHPMTNEATTSIARNDLLKFVQTTGHEPHIITISEE